MDDKFGVSYYKDIISQIIYKTYSISCSCIMFSDIAVDIVLNEEPWLNATTACTFPLSSTSTERNMLHEDLDLTITSLSDLKHAKSKHKKVDQFLGQYGNFGYGNLTVVVDDVLEELIVNFDAYSCVVRNVTGERESCTGLGIYWFLSLWRVQFDEENNPSRFVDVTFTVTEGPMRFERDLLFEDAPGSRDHWPQCEEVFPGKI